ncbi:hypothetical protein KBI5_12615 [Frankia sp. KB5]|nr:hypothetical protein KBI5_12615 [Frankia sp. KB5]
MAKSSGGKSGAGRSGGKGAGCGQQSGGTRMTQERASKIQSAGDSRPDSATGRSGFGSRARSAGDRNAQADKSGD